MITRGNYKPTDIAYLAGFIDGEGSISICKTNSSNSIYKTPRYVLEVTVTNTYKPIIDMFQELFAGSWTRRRHEKHPVWKQSYCIRWASIKAKEILELVYPHLIVKKEQAEVAIEFQSTKTKNRGFFPVKAGKGLSHRLSKEEIEKRDFYYQKMLKLNGRHRPAETKRSDTLARVKR